VSAAAGGAALYGSFLTSSSADTELGIRSRALVRKRRTSWRLVLSPGMRMALEEWHWSGHRAWPDPTAGKRWSTVFSTSGSGDVHGHCLLLTAVALLLPLCRARRATKVDRWCATVRIECRIANLGIRIESLFFLRRKGREKVGRRKILEPSPMDRFSERESLSDTE